MANRKPISTTESKFLLAALAERKRIDGRDAYDYRPIRVQFGSDRGCCYVEIGDTKVLAQVSCSVTTPKDSRPNDGLLVTNVEFSPMAGPQFEANRAAAPEVIETSRIVERCIKESRCLDLESLCLLSGAKVWSIRVDAHVLSHCGNVIDAANMAAMGALLHFRRPDVTVCGTDLTIHTLTERDPIPLAVHHIPLSVTSAFYEGGKYQCVDPTELEERVMDGRMIVAINKHRDICMLQITGSMLLLREQLTRCTSMAASKVATMTEILLEALQKDEQIRKTSAVAAVQLEFGCKKLRLVESDSQSKIKRKSPKKSKLKTKSEMSVIEVDDDDDDDDDVVMMQVDDNKRHDDVVSLESDDNVVSLDSDEDKLIN